MGYRHKTQLGCLGHRNGLFVAIILNLIVRKLTVNQKYGRWEFSRGAQTYGKRSIPRPSAGLPGWAGAVGAIACAEIST